MKLEIKTGDRVRLLPVLGLREQYGEVLDVDRINEVALICVDPKDREDYDSDGLCEVVLNEDYGPLQFEVLKGEKPKNERKKST